MISILFCISVISLFLFFVSVGTASASETIEEQILRISGNVLSTPYTFNADSLYEAMVTGEADSFHIISLQSEKEYKNGHIPGAVRLEIDLENPEPALKALPEDKTIVVTCSNGQMSCLYTTFLRQLGYDARNLLVGLEGWNKKYSGSGACIKTAGLPVTDEEVPLELTEDCRSTPSDLDDRGVILKVTADYASQGRPAIISPQEARDMENTVFISLQAPEDYAYGHIVGTANLPALKFLEGSTDLLRLPRDKKIIVTCYMGHYSNIGSFILNQLGYEAYSMDWGLTGWNTDGFEKPLIWLQGDSEYPVDKG